MCVCVHARVHACVCVCAMCVCLFGYSLVFCLLRDVYLVFVGFGGCCIRFLVFQKELKLWVGMGRGSRKTFGHENNMIKIHLYLKIVLNNKKKQNSFMLENHNTNQVYFQPRFKDVQVCPSF